MRYTGKGRIKGLIVIPERRGAVNVYRSANLLSYLPYRCLFTIELVAYISKIMHESLFSPIHSSFFIPHSALNRPPPPVSQITMDLSDPTGLSFQALH